MQLCMVNQNNGSRIRMKPKGKYDLKNEMKPRLYRDMYTERISTIIKTGYFKLEL